MFFQDATPDTSSYMILGYTIFFIVLAIYLISFFVRSRNLKQDMSMLETLKPESKRPESKPAADKMTSSRMTAGKVTAGKVTAGKATGKPAKAKTAGAKTRKKK